MINDSINRFLGVLCYPFLSLETFEEDLIGAFLKAAHSHQKGSEGTAEETERIRKRLKSQLIDYIRDNFTIYSYDEIYLYLEKCYLYDALDYDSPLSMYLKVMKRMADALISHRDGRIVFKYWENKEDKDLFGGFAGSNKVTLFHSLNCHIPMDVIAIVYMVANQREPDIRCLNYFYGTIEAADQQLSMILKKGVAENHLHKGVSRTFPSIWDSLMEPLTAKKKKTFRNKSLVTGTKDHKKRILFYVLGCGMVRGWLAYQMSLPMENWEKGPKEVRILAKEFRYGKPFEEHYKREFQTQEADEIISYYAGLWKELEDFLPEGALDGNLCRIALKEDSGVYTFDENVFLYRALDGVYYKKMSEDFGLCLLQYLRVRNYFFHESVQQKTIKGLYYFQQEHYTVNSVLNRMNTNHFWENAIREQLQNQDLQKIEFRFSMHSSYQSLKKEVRSFLEAYKNVLEKDYCFFDGDHYIPKQKFPRVGLVLHFLKRPDPPVPKKCFVNGTADCASYRFGALQASYMEQAKLFVKLRSEFSELSRYLVGIDAASLENSTPVWVFVPVYNQARDSQVEQIGKNPEGECYTQSLGFTFHAGEDFRHILSGLRRIDEAVEHLKFHAGDRIGHGIALGLSPNLWRNQNPVIIIPRLEALENYLWAYDTLRKNYGEFQSSILAYMEQRIFALSKDIYGDTAAITLEMMIRSYNSIFSEDVAGEMLEEETVCRLCKNLKEKEQIPWNAKLLTAARHCNVFARKMDQPIHYEVTQQDLSIIQEMQKLLKKKLGRKGIVLEVNPSSNLAIGEIDRLGENQFYQMNKVNEEENVIICINSDDPAVFNTNVSNELAYIYYGMLDKNVSREAALLWIDRVRRNGMDSSFIRRQESDGMLLKKLTELLEQM